MELHDNSGAGSELGNTAVRFAGLFSIIATGISLYCMWSHLKNYARPNLQRNVMRIIWMIPVYAISSWISLYSLKLAFYVDALRDVYEAFVLYCFFSLLVNYLGGERELLNMLHGRQPTEHMWPVNWWSKEMDIGDPYNFLFVKRGILQYVYIKPVLAAATMILKLCNKFNEGDLSLTSGYFWVSFIYNLSVCLSLYCLVLFFMATKEDLKAYRPFPKFLCVKSVIFFSFWQGLGISILVMLGIIRGNERFNADQLAVAIQDFLICFEMIFAAIGHWHSFTYKDYNNYDFHFGRMTLPHAIRDALGLRDIIQDSLETYSGDRFNYRAFEPAEGVVPEGQSRNQRILAGLRYVDGGQTKYWIPTPETAAKAGPNDLQSHMDSDTISLNFPDVNESDGMEDDYEAARQLVHGDYNYPIITVSSPIRKPTENQRIKGKNPTVSYSATGETHSASASNGTKQQAYGNQESQGLHQANESEESQGLLRQANESEESSSDDDHEDTPYHHTGPTSNNNASQDSLANWQRQEPTFPKLPSQSSLYNPWS
ncbi:DUF300-domain-containing protein [Basidiobolus meristosporus CBS 931.73]|uniref:DUF300-domain-containing protein n=1 Tax=Basidiobolus meristosporus CBS 931.73 TaxID=1314790 RepID=A0A1Y1YD10_9FUNG|nr:DUF300-domain-containing protein [Basidiobolus meristosporus CBS 931.73]|eukprot:ORX95911.1 DUF300-domain-containing protein [Basidiobolus meristosporus CBS 931.73]